MFMKKIIISLAIVCVILTMISILLLRENKSVINRNRELKDSVTWLQILQDKYMDYLWLEYRKKDEDFPRILSRADSAEIEKRSHREIINIDVPKLNIRELKHLKDYLKNEKYIICDGMKLCLDYELNDSSYAVLHFRYDEKYDCPLDCPDMYIQLSDSEYKKLKEHIKKIPKKIYNNVVSNRYETYHQRTISSTADYFLVKLEEIRSDTLYRGVERFLRIGYKNKDVTYHIHHHFGCQTHMTPQPYERIWRSQQKKKDNCDSQ